MIKIGEILTLSNNKKYVVVNTTYFNSNYFCYLVEFNDFHNEKIYMIDGDNLFEVRDNVLIKKLEKIFVKGFNQ